ncbi:LysM peptidoglycan-binding domain-containing protein [Actinomyces sp. W5033]|uniref:LysM peptidoglycan-binding domain-containing protein n=1 Tax=Actinomyces sp. W5033 TaxID=3446479 RepID=UPI003EE26F7E
MSALAVPPSPRLRAVPAARAQQAVVVRLTARTGGGSNGQQPAAPQGPGTPAPQVVGGGGPGGGERRGNLRLVTQDVPGAGAPERGLPARSLSLELTRRPVAVRRASGPRADSGLRSELSPRADSGLRAEDLAPTHPAVRAARARRAQAAASRHARSEDSRTPLARRQQRPRPALSQVPAPLRRLAVAAAGVLVVVLLAAGAIVASAFAAPEPTVVATVLPGQSIWDIAVATGSSNVADAAARIVELNNLTSSTLQAGQTLIVPVG